VSGGSSCSRTKSRSSTWSTFHHKAIMPEPDTHGRRSARFQTSSHFTDSRAISRGLAPAFFDECPCFATEEAPGRGV
jgi:hypothetical protein